MLSLYEILKASKTGIAPDMWTALAGANFGGAGSGAEVKELTGIPPLSFTANGQPLLDYLISGNMSQSDTPTPTTPIQPQETGERTGNLFDESTIEVGGLNINTGAEVENRSRRRSGFIKVTPSTEYTLTRVIDATKSNLWVIGYDANKNVISDSSGTQPTVLTSIDGNSTVGVFNTTTSTEYIRWYVTTNGSYSDIMLNSGSTALPYEPYGYKIPILSAGQTTPVYLGEVETTRKIKKLVLTGEEAFAYSSQNDNRYVCSLTYSTLNMSDAIGICSHFVWKRNYEPTVYNKIVRASNTVFYLSLANDLLDEVSTNGFKAYLAAQYANGTPVTIWYVLATPTTGIVNEPLRKIGDYADTLSYEQAGVEIPTLNGQTVIDVETALKPSEMYIKYQE